MFTAFGVTIVLYFIKILSGSRTFYLSSAISHPRFIFHPPFLIRHPYPPSLSAILISHPYPRFIPTRLPIDSIDYEQTFIYEQKFIYLFYYEQKFIYVSFRIHFIPRERNVKL